jgi:hypothetical protein
MLERLPPFASNFPFSLPWLSQIKLSKSVEKVRGYNRQIDVQGDTARAQWYLFMPCTLGEGNRAMWRAGVDHEEYVRVAGEWKFKRKTSAPLFHTPFEEGWAKTRFV